METIARHQYDPRPYIASDLSFEGDKGKTRKADAVDCDINSIFKRYEKSGVLPDMIMKDPRYGDFTQVPTYHEALTIVRLAQEQFDALDVNIRNRFANDPEKFLEFTQNPENKAEMDRMGLLTPEASKALAAEVEAKNAPIVAAEKAAQEAAFAARVKAVIEKP